MWVRVTIPYTAATVTTLNALNVVVHFDVGGPCLNKGQDGNNKGRDGEDEGHCESRVEN